MVVFMNITLSFSPELKDGEALLAIKMTEKVRDHYLTSIIMGGVGNC